MTARALATVLAIVLVAPSAHAYRPFDGTDADVAGPGELELEIGPLGYLRTQHDSAVVFANSVVNYGLSRHWELVLQGVGVEGLASTPPPPRFIDGGLFLKHVLREGVLQGKSGISLATEFGILLPTYDEPIASDGGVYLGMILSYAWPELVVHFNASLARSSDGQPDVFGSVILEAHPEGRIRPVAELFVDRHDGQTIPSGLIGCIARATEHLSFDGATRLAWSDGAPLFEVRVGLTWTIPLLHLTGGGGG